MQKKNIFLFSIIFVLILVLVFGLIFVIDLSKKTQNWEQKYIESERENKELLEEKDLLKSELNYYSREDKERTGGQTFWEYFKNNRTELDSVTYSYSKTNSIDVYIEKDGVTNRVIKGFYVQPNGNPPTFRTTTQKDIVLLDNFGGDLCMSTRESYYINNKLMDYVLFSEINGCGSHALRIEKDESNFEIKYNVIGVCEQLPESTPEAERECLGEVVVDGLLLDEEKIVNFDKKYTVKCEDNSYLSRCLYNLEDMRFLGADKERGSAYFSSGFTSSTYQFDLNNKTIKETEEIGDILKTWY